MKKGFFTRWWSSDNAESKQIDAHNSVLWTVANHVVLDIIRADAACDNFHCGEKYLEASDGILPFGTVVTKSRDKKSQVYVPCTEVEPG